MKNNKNVVIDPEHDCHEYERYKRNREYLVMLNKSVEQVKEGNFMETALEELVSFEQTN